VTLRYPAIRLRASLMEATAWGCDDSLLWSELRICTEPELVCCADPACALTGTHHPWPLDWTHPLLSRCFELARDLCPLPGVPAATHDRCTIRCPSRCSSSYLISTPNQIAKDNLPYTGAILKLTGRTILITRATSTSMCQGSLPDYLSASRAGSASECAPVPRR
jgi:hypothetical protein